MFYDIFLLNMFGNNNSRRLFSWQNCLRFGIHLTFFSTYDRQFLFKLRRFGGISAAIGIDVHIIQIPELIIFEVSERETASAAASTSDMHERWFIAKSILETFNNFKMSKILKLICKAGRLSRRFI